MLGPENLSEAFFAAPDEASVWVLSNCLMNLSFAIAEPHAKSRNLRVVASPRVWSEMVAKSFAQFRQTDSMLLFPWETAVLAETFNFQQDPLPGRPGLAEIRHEQSAAASDNMQEQLQRFLMPGDAKYVHGVKSLQDLSYFESKTQKLDLACGQWLNILSLVASLQRDHTCTDAIYILKVCFGVKSPATLLK